MRKASILVYSRKGNTLGILEELDGDWFNSFIYDTGKMHPSIVENKLLDSEVILLGAPTYFPTYLEVPEFPVYWEKFRDMFNRWKGKTIIVFGSGRSEYPLFCGAVDYLLGYLSVENKVYHYKFEGFPKPSEQREFRELVEEILNA